MGWREIPEIHGHLHYLHELLHYSPILPFVSYLKWELDLSELQYFFELISSITIFFIIDPSYNSLIILIQLNKAKVAQMKRSQWLYCSTSSNLTQKKKKNKLLYLFLILLVSSILNPLIEKHFTLNRISQFTHWHVSHLFKVCVRCLSYFHVLSVLVYLLCSPHTKYGCSFYLFVFIDIFFLSGTFFLKHSQRSKAFLYVSRQRSDQLWNMECASNWFNWQCEKE